MRETIGGLARGTPPVTILLTSHNLAEVEELCGRVAVISRGRIRALDTPARLRSKSRQQETARVKVAAVTQERAAELLEGVVPRVETSMRGELVGLSFRREVGDSLLDGALRALVAGGARVVECESERGSLLDVIEELEREGAGEEGAGGR